MREITCQLLQFFADVILAPLNQAEVQCKHCTGGRNCSGKSLLCTAVWSLSLLPQHSLGQYRIVPSCSQQVLSCSLHSGRSQDEFKDVRIAASCCFCYPYTQPSVLHSVTEFIFRVAGQPLQPSVKNHQYSLVVFGSFFSFLQLSFF